MTRTNPLWVDNYPAQWRGYEPQHYHVGANPDDASQMAMIRTSPRPDGATNNTNTRPTQRLESWKQLESDYPCVVFESLVWSWLVPPGGTNRDRDLVFGSPVTRLEKDRNQTGP